MYIPIRTLIRFICEPNYVDVTVRLGSGNQAMHHQEITFRIA